MLIRRRRHPWYNYRYNCKWSKCVGTKILVVIAAVALIALVIGAVMVMKGSSGGSAAKTATPKPAASGAVKAAETGKLQVTDETTGTGDESVAGKSVTVNYTGTLQDGTVFDSTAKEGGKPFTFTLGGGQVIKGWDQGVVGMKVGGKRKLVIPPDLGYGSQGAGSSIPPNATLTFEIELLKVADASSSSAGQ